MDVLNLYDVEFSAQIGYEGRAIVQARTRDEAEMLLKTLLSTNNYAVSSADMYDFEKLEPGNEPGVIMLGVND